MFEAWSTDAVASARPVPVWTRPTAPRFTPAPKGMPTGFSAWAAETPASQPEPIDPGIELDAIRADAFAQGFDAGSRTERELLAQERESLAQLAGALENFRPEPAADLARLLSEAVSRLVRQVCGEVEADPALMAERTMAIAAMIQDETGPSRLRLHPADIERLEGAALPMPVYPDPTLAEGTILAETATGWVEDGPAIRLEKLRGLLDALACAR